MSLIGFTGSGQFTFLGFVNQDLESVGYITAFIVILSKIYPYELVSN